MNSAYFGLLDMAVVGVPVVGIGVWQLISINREIARDRAAKAALPERPGHAVGEHGLDDR